MDIARSNKAIQFALLDAGRQADYMECFTGTCWRFHTTALERLTYATASNPHLRLSQPNLLQSSPTGDTTTSSTGDSLTTNSACQEKKRMERIDTLKEDIKTKPAARRAARELRKPVDHPPRYDEVYRQGLRWLGELTGIPEEA